MGGASEQLATLINLESLLFHFHISSFSVLAIIIVVSSASVTVSRSHLEGRTSLLYLDKARITAMGNGMDGDADRRIVSADFDVRLIVCQSEL